MPNRETPRSLLQDLQERAKELQCVYRVEEQLVNAEGDLEDTLQRVVEVVPPGWQHAEACAASIEYDGRVYRSKPFEPSAWSLRADIALHGQRVGALAVYYLEEFPDEEVGPFLREEERLIRSIADRLGHHILYRTVDASRLLQAGQGSLTIREASEWPAAVRLLRDADREQYSRLARKMLNRLVSLGVERAAQMLGRPNTSEVVFENENQPERALTADRSLLSSDLPFELASEHLDDEEIWSLIQQWLREEKAAVFNKVLADPASTLAQVADALRRFRTASPDGLHCARSTAAGIRASLIRRTMSSQTEFIRRARPYMDPFDFVDLFDHLVISREGQGTVGGKSSGLLLATAILRRAREKDAGVPAIRTPKAWFLASDAMLAFINHNDLEEVVEQKYKEIDQVRSEYPNIIQLFKASSFPPEVLKGLSVALDDFGEGTPLIVRSSSLLEDRLGTAFSGKYKSLFVANQGSKAHRLSQLLDAIAEVYASVFGPDPIEYRRERGLLDFHEEMGVLIQEVVGRRVGRWFFPAFAGVAFSRNEFRWSPRIERDDGIVRLVPGLGTRAVDRTADDYPVLCVPGKAGLRANVALDEIVRYSPHRIDCIDLLDDHFVTVDLKILLEDAGTDLPGFSLLFGKIDGDRLQPANALLTDPSRDELVCNFEGLLSKTSFAEDIGTIMDRLEEALGFPVDIEFAHDGENFYLLQCRAQSSSADERPDAIPQDLEQRETLFSANRYVSNGQVPDLTHIVYVDPQEYADLPSEQRMRDVGRAIGQLNELLPRHQFALIGPGRWGSRGDIRLGVPVTYSQINNTALLVEVARRSGHYLPDLSFGTHFFQDLVESRIRYLPLYPDDEGVNFNEPFFTRSRNLLAELLPQYEDLQDVVRVIDVPASQEGHIVRVLLNGDLDEAVAFLADPGPRPDFATVPSPAESATPRPASEYWRWRERMAEQIAQRLDPARFGVKAMYLFGSVKNGNAGPGSDIDLLVHIEDDERKRRDLQEWLDGWSECLAEVNYLRTGYQTDGLLDVHFITDEDIEQRTSWASKIGAITDPATPLRLGGGTS